MTRPEALPGFDDPAPPAPPGGGAPTRLDAAAAIRAFGDLMDGHPLAARDLRRLGLRVVPAQGRRLDIDAATSLFRQYVEAVAAGRYGGVPHLTRRLHREAGVIVLRMPPRSEP